LAADFPKRFEIDKHSGLNLIRNIAFEESSLLRGEDIAIPNRYYGFVDGSVIIGM
jgi:hypothetical protein